MKKQRCKQKNTNMTLIRLGVCVCFVYMCVSVWCGGVLPEVPLLGP